MIDGVEVFRSLGRPEEAVEKDKIEDDLILEIMQLKVCGVRN